MEHFPQLVAHINEVGAFYELQQDLSGEKHALTDWLVEVGATGHTPQQAYDNYTTIVKKADEIMKHG